MQLIFPVRCERGHVWDDGGPLEPGDDIGGGAVAPVVAPPLPLPLLPPVPLALPPYPAICSEDIIDFDMLLAREIQLQPF